LILGPDAIVISVNELTKLYKDDEPGGHSKRITLPRLEYQAPQRSRNIFDDDIDGVTDLCVTAVKSL
jgi:hypothetical protein